MAGNLCSESARNLTIEPIERGDFGVCHDGLKRELQTDAFGGIRVQRWSHKEFPLFCCPSTIPSLGNLPHAAV